MITRDDVKSYIAGISDVKISDDAKNVRYNLSGMRVDDSYKGVVVENGKKIVLK